MHPANRLRSLLGLLAALAVLPTGVMAYNLGAQKWTTGTVVMHLQLGPATAALVDGSASWGASAEDALASWSANLNNVKFSIVRDSTAAIAAGNSVNNVFWSSTIYGDAWDDRTLAITLSSYGGRNNNYTEADVIFNNTLDWNSYRGAQRTTAGRKTLYDFHRVALHEFGHVLGLNHPDDIKQTVSAIMNSTSGDIDALTADDIAGAKAIYDSSTAIPASAVSIAGAIGYSRLGSNVTITAAGIKNEGNATSGTLRLELWAMPSHYATGLPIGSRNLGNYTLTPPSTLAANTQISNLSGTTTYTDPPSGTYYVVVLLTEFTGASGTGYSIRDSVEFSGPLVVGNGISVPAIAVQPTAQTASAGSPLSLSVVATGTAPLTYQWFKDGTAVAGATSATLQFASVSASNAGSYTVKITNSAGSVTSSAAVLSVSGLSRITNLSILTTIDSPVDTFTLGYVVGNAGEKNSLQLIVRAAGPALGALGYPGTMSDPKFELFAGSAPAGGNNDWGGTAALKTAFTSVGAFAYASDTSTDAASLASITTSNNSVKVSANDGGTGAVIAEVYDATPAASVSASGPRLVNVSVLKPIGANLTVGFVIGGTGSKNLLIRASGPALTAFGYFPSSVIADPKLTLYSGQTVIATNDTWGGGSALTAAFTAAGAFAFSANSLDAAVIATLPPGAYTVVVAPSTGATGIGLVEVYELP